VRLEPVAEIIDAKLLHVLGAHCLFTSKRLLIKYYRGLQPKSHRGITSKLLLVLGTRVILVIALYEDIAEGQFKR
jgi:hypothetical protein